MCTAHSADNLKGDNLYFWQRRNVIYTEINNWLYFRFEIFDTAVSCGCVPFILYSAAVLRHYSKLLL